jgi:hypothetical protein
VAQVRPVIVPLWVRQTKGSAAREIQMTGAGLVGCASPEVSRSSSVSYDDRATGRRKVAVSCDLVLR